MAKSLYKEGQVLESFQGKFAKVVKVGTDGRFALTAWVSKKEVAEADGVVARWLNQFGLSQVLKGGKGIGTGDSTTDAAEPAEEKKVTSKASVKAAEEKK